MTHINDTITIGPSLKPLSTNKLKPKIYNIQFPSYIRYSTLISALKFYLISFQHTRNYKDI